MTAEPTVGETAGALAGANVRQLTQRLCEVEAVLAVVGQLGATLRAALLERAIARWAEDGTAPTFRAPGLGSVSLSVPQERVVVDDQAAFSSWVAEHHPAAATARVVISCPPDQLEMLLEGLAALREMPGVTVAADVEVSAPFVKRLLDEQVVVADSGDTRAAIDTASGALVDGVKVVKGADPADPDAPRPRSISVRLEPQAKADASAQAAARLGTVLEHGLSDALAADVRELPGPSMPDMPASVDEAAGEPDEEPDMCACTHLRVVHRGKVHRGGCPECRCSKFRVPAVAW